MEYVLCPGKSARSVDFTHDVAEWKYHCPSDDNDMEIIQSPTLLAEANSDILAAKQRELQAWHSQEAFQEVPDHGQRCMSVHWVITPTVINGVPSTKARLCAKGFQEIQDFCTDSPMCSSESIQLALSVTASMQ